MSICYRLRLIYAQKKGNYKKICNNKITVRVERRKTKMEWFKHKNRSRQFLLSEGKFAIIAKNTGIAKIEIFAMHSTFRYDREISL